MGIFVRLSLARTLPSVDDRANFKGTHDDDGAVVIVDCVPREIPGVPRNLSPALALISVELNALLKRVSSRE